MNAKETIEEIKKFSTNSPSFSSNDNNNEEILGNSLKSSDAIIQSRPKLYIAARKTVPNYKKDFNNNDNNDNNNLPLNNFIPQSLALDGNINLSRKQSYCVKTASFNPLSHKLPKLLCKKHCRSPSLHSNESSKLDNDAKHKEEKCFICHWVFPSIMIPAEREAHVNKCLDNEGEEDKRNFLESHKQAIKDNNIYCAENDETICPFCFLKIITNMKKHKEICINKVKK